MAITKSTAVDQVTVTENGIVLYREATRIMEDGNELSKTYHRSSLDTGPRPDWCTYQCCSHLQRGMDSRSHCRLPSSVGSKPPCRSITMTLILSGTDGLSDVDGSAATPAIRGTDANTGIFFPAADTIAFSEGGAEIARFELGEFWDWYEFAK
jgi:hypothetical protein